MIGFAVGTRVEWDWGTGVATGEVTERFTERVTRTLKGTEVTREARDDEPAYLITQSAGAEVLKSHSEVRRASQSD